MTPTNAALRMPAEDVRDEAIALFPPPYVLNYNAAPYVPRGWEVESHEKRPVRGWNLDDIGVLWSRNWPKRAGIRFSDVLRDVPRKQRVNANFLDHLLFFEKKMEQFLRRDDFAQWNRLYFIGTRYKAADSKEIYDHDSGCALAEPRILAGMPAVRTLSRRHGSRYWEEIPVPTTCLELYDSPEKFGRHGILVWRH